MPGKNHPLAQRRVLLRVTNAVTFVIGTLFRNTWNTFLWWPLFYHLKVKYKLWPSLKRASLSFQVCSCVSISALTNKLCSTPSWVVLHSFIKTKSSHWMGPVLKSIWKCSLRKECLRSSALICSIVLHHLRPKSAVQNQVSPKFEYMDTRTRFGLQHFHM